MALLTPAKELAVRAKLKEIFEELTDIYVFDRPRQIVSKQHFEAHTTKTILGKKEIRYLEFYFVDFVDLDDEAQLDADCVPVDLLYEGQIGFSYVESRSDDSNSFNDIKACILDLRNMFLDNGDLIISGITYELKRMEPLRQLRIERHPVTEQEMHLYDFKFSVGVRE